MDFPVEPAELAPDWLTAVLRAAGAIDTARVVSCQFSPLAEKQGFYGQVVRVTPVYDREEAGAPPALIAKFASAVPEMRERAVPAYVREVRFYQQVAGRTSLPVPVCYFAGIDAETGLHLLLLEDMAPARSGARVQGCTPAQAELAIRAIAAFHAFWWENPLLREFDWLEDGSNDPDADAQQALHERWWPEFLRRADNRVPEPIRAIGERLGPQRAAIRRHVFGSPPQTLIHHDYQLDNLVFGGPNGGVAFAVLDWQLASCGRGVWDAAYFLSENLTEEARRAVGTDLLRLYWQALTEHGVQGYTFEQCWLDFRYCLLQRFNALISTIAAMPFSEEQRRLHVDVLLPRNSAAILDSRAGKLLE